MNMTKLSDTQQEILANLNQYLIYIKDSMQKAEKESFAPMNSVDSIKKWIDDTLDHKHLNDVFDFNPTVEFMSKYIFDLFRKNQSVDCL